MKPLLLRVWHWLNAIVISLLLITVFFRNTFFSAKANAAFIINKLSVSGITISEDLAKDISRGLRDEMFQWHFRFGIILAMLLGLRIVAAYRSSEGNLGLARRYFKEKNYEEFFVRSLYVVFYIALTIMVLTGLTLYLGKDFGVSKDSLSSIKVIHETTMKFFLVFISLHLTGVVLGEIGKRKGIVSEMINGRK